MIPEVGHFSLILALGLSVLLCILPLAGSYRRDTSWMRSAFSLANGVFVFTAISFGCLTWGFLHDDFSVRYIAQNSNSLLPWFYKLSAVWGAHEGSFLLWTLIMSGWTLAVAWFSGHLPLTLSSRVLGIMGLLMTGFVSFILFTSNPFERLLPLSPSEGGDLNPLLQDFGLVVHPPILYTGYVGFSVAFAFAIAALLSRRLDASWARWSRPWTNTAWAFLSIGIALGSWWAYYELGWGGWWFWDPVENASFMPWLVGTALIHSLAVTEKRGAFKSWTVLLAIAAFSFSLLGAFIVRSGVLTSVHAFAVDPERGLFILAFLVLVVGGSLTLYALRAPVIRSHVHFSGLSRETLLLVNNLLLVVAATGVLLGTLYPLAYEWISEGKKISVGPPYFNTIFVPLMVLLSVVLGIAPIARWKKTSVGYLMRQLGWVALASVVLGVVLPLLLHGGFKWQAALAFALGAWIILSHVKDLWFRMGSKVSGLGKVPLGYYGMAIAHIGFAVSLMGVAVTSHYSLEKDVSMGPGDQVEMGPLQFTFMGVSQKQGPNFLAQEGEIRVVGDGKVYRLTPQKRRYLAQGSVMTEAAINPGIFKDVYVAMGEPTGQDSWAVRLHYKPLVRWIWFGGLLMALGGFVAVLDKRYRRARQKAGAPLQQADAVGVQSG